MNRPYTPPRRPKPRRDGRQHVAPTFRSACAHLKVGATSPFRAHRRKRPSADESAPRARCPRLAKRSSRIVPVDCHAARKDRTATPASPACPPGRGPSSKTPGRCPTTDEEKRAGRAHSTARRLGRPASRPGGYYIPPRNRGEGDAMRRRLGAKRRAGSRAMSYRPAGR